MLAGDKSVPHPQAVRACEPRPEGAVFPRRLGQSLFCLRRCTTMKVKTENSPLQLNVPPDLETLINKRLSSGGYAGVEDVLRRALEAQDAEGSWTDEEGRVLSSHIEEGYLQAERGELIDAIRPAVKF